MFLWKQVVGICHIVVFAISDHTENVAIIHVCAGAANAGDDIIALLAGPITVPSVHRVLYLKPNFVWSERERF